MAVAIIWCDISLDGPITPQAPLGSCNSIPSMARQHDSSWMSSVNLRLAASLLRGTHFYATLAAFFTQAIEEPYYVFYSYDQDVSSSIELR